MCDNAIPLEWLKMPNQPSEPAPAPLPASMPNNDSTDRNYLIKESYYIRVYLLIDEQGRRHYSLKTKAKHISVQLCAKLDTSTSIII